MAATDFDFSQTRTQIIERAHRIVGALSHGDTLTAEQNTFGSDCLNAVVKEWQTQNLFLWRLEACSVAVLSGAHTFTLEDDPAVIAIDKAWVVDTDDDPLELISWRTYNNIPDKTKTGKPLYITVEPDSGTATMWPVLDANYTIKYLGIGKLKDWDANSSTGDLPIRFVNALTYAVARDLADEYGLPIGERQFLERKAAMFFDTAKRSDRDRNQGCFIKGAY